MKEAAPVKLNLGCGTNKIPGFLNVDTEKTCKPDILCDFVSKKLPLKSGTVDEIVFFHCIEHIRKCFHKRILTEIWRLLKPGTQVFISYPEFSKCYKNWATNFRGKRDFWEKTMFGRQLYASDYHVCAMHTPEFKDLLKDCGFESITNISEEIEPHNTIVTATKGLKPLNYEDLIRADIANTTIKK